MKIFGKHRVRASFYHIGAIVFVGITLFTYLGVVSTTVGFILNAILFIIDYIAEMFDPHPDNMGTWYERYFHRVYDGNED